MEAVEVCPECGREIRSVDGKQISSCVHRPLDFISFLESLTEEFTLVRREVPCPKCKAMISFNHVATTEAVERSVHCTSCLHANCVVVEGVKPELKCCDYDTNGDGDCHRCCKLGGCKAIGGPFSKDVADGSAQTQE